MCIVSLNSLLFYSIYQADIPLQGGSRDKVSTYMNSHAFSLPSRLSPFMHSQLLSTHLYHIQQFYIASLTFLLYLMLSSNCPFIPFVVISASHLSYQIKLSLSPIVPILFSLSLCPITPKNCSARSVKSLSIPVLLYTS